MQSKSHLHNSPRQILRRSHTIIHKEPTPSHTRVKTYYNCENHLINNSNSNKNIFSFSKPSEYFSILNRSSTTRDSGLANSCSNLNKTNFTISTNQINDYSKGLDLCYKLFPIASPESSTKGKPKKINWNYHNTELSQVASVGFKSRVVKKVLKNIVIDPSNSPILGRKLSPKTTFSREATENSRPYLKSDIENILESLHANRSRRLRSL
ncbi:unnamed protein product [Blepharisma stoltei]|uniref:Uncharacterized protein n=1 Tax=Blepharisma stoltei TaxID=1481888 RepID=A0AAU9JTH3_9CILI|nr:unnamed protein product [Blepharisma stoltei]